MSKALNVKDVIMRILQIMPIFSAPFGGPLTVVRYDKRARSDVIMSFTFQE